MPYVNVHIEADEVLSDTDTADLEEELNRRKRKARRGASDEAEAWDFEGAAADLRTAFYARNACRFEAILASLAPPAQVSCSTAVARFPGAMQ